MLLDHGLYRQIDDNVRLHYAGLWQALVLGDVPKIEHHCRGLNAGDAVPIFAGLLTARPWNEVTNRSSINHLALTGTQAERDELQVASTSMSCYAQCPAYSPLQSAVLLALCACLISGHNWTRDQSVAKYVILHQIREIAIALVRNSMVPLLCCSAQDCLPGGANRCKIANSEVMCRAMPSNMQRKSHRCYGGCPKRYCCS